jgi:hypothetical protein
MLFPTCEFKFALMDFYSEGLKKEPGALAYIIGYNGKRPIPKTLKYHLDKAREWLADTVPQERIVIVNGGYRDEPVIELWLVPKGAAAPTPTPTYFPKKRGKLSHRNPD